MLSVFFKCADGSVGALRSNSLATHKSVYMSASRHSVSDDASGASNKPEAEILCHICKGECSKQRFYHRRVSPIPVLHLLPIRIELPVW